jgi:hypothetical protein
MTHDFSRSLSMSHAASDWHGWEYIYKQAFSSFASMVDHRKDGEHQRAGIDRSVVLDNAKQILVDEKVRFRNKNGKVYDDVLIEIWSDHDKRVLGWGVKPLRADFIAYAILPLGKCYMLPVVGMQKAVRVNCRSWVKSYNWRRASNKTNGRCWETWSVPVPAGELFSAISSVSCVTFEPTDLVK